MHGQRIFAIGGEREWNFGFLRQSGFHRHEARTFSSSLHDADPRSDRPECGGRESNFLIPACLFQRFRSGSPYVV